MKYMPLIAIIETAKNGIKPKRRKASAWYGRPRADDGRPLYYRRECKNMYNSTLSREKLRLRYSLLKEAEKLAREYGNNPAKMPSVKALKAEIRQEYHWDAKQDEYSADYPTWRAYNADDYDRRYCVYIIEGHMNDAEKEAYKESNWVHWYNPYDDGRDCTGIWFTSYIKLVDCGSNTAVIHWQNCDV